MVASGGDPGCPARLAEIKQRFLEEEEVSTTSAASGSKKPVVLILAIIGVLAIIVGILYMVGATPAFLNIGSHVHNKGGGHLIRGAVAIVVGLGLGVFAFIQNKKS